MSDQLLDAALREDVKKNLFARRLVQREPSGWRHFVLEKPMLPFLIPLFFLAWATERWIVPFSNWVPVCITVWATIQYNKFQQRQLLEDLNNKWKRHFLCSQPTTPLEPCEWLNKLLLYIWPNYIEKRLSYRFRAIVQKRIKEKKPRPIQSIEVHDFILGTAPPTFGLQRTYWSMEGSQAVLHMGFEWNTNEMSVLLAAKLGGPFAGKMARININSVHIKGDLRLLPILDGQAILYSFESTPEVRLGLAFGSGNQHLPATELPVVASWLEKLILETLNRTMVEPRRRCFSLFAEDLRKHAIGGVLSVTVVSAKNILDKSPDKRTSGSSSGNGAGSSNNGGSGVFVELILGKLTRKTDVCHSSGTTLHWNDPITMIFHENAVILHLNIYGQKSNTMKCTFLGTCEIKLKYVNDGSSTFWAIGKDRGVIAARVEHCGKDVQMTVPVEEPNSGEITVKLDVREWYFADDARRLRRSPTSTSASTSSDTQQMPIYSNWVSSSHMTGRKIKVTVIEGRNLAPKDRSGKSDPYLKLQYGKVTKRTKTIQQNLNPVWNQDYEFEEFGDGEYLKLKCYDADILMNDESMGSAQIHLHGLELRSAKDVWVPLEKIDRGEIHLKIEVFESSESQRIASDENNNAILLELVVVEAKGLVAADWNGTSDPYVSVRYGNVRKRTKVMYKNLNPQWSETIDFIDDGSSLSLHVKDYNAIMPTSSIGHCDIEYRRLPLNQTVDRWIQLQGVSKGEIHIQITRTELVKQHQHQQQNDVQSQSTTTAAKARHASSKIGAVMARLSVLISEGEREELQSELDELENAQEEERQVMVQLEREKELLLSKIKDLEQAMDALSLSAFTN